MKRFFAPSVVAAAAAAALMLGAVRMAALAEGPIPDCLYIAEGTGVGLLPPAQERFVCDVAVEAGTRTISLGWTAGAMGSVTLDLAGDGDGDGENAASLFRMHCTVRAGLSECQTATALPYEGSDRWMVLTGPFDAQRIATIMLDRPATLTVTAGPVSQTPLLLGEGVFGVTVDEGNPILCLLPVECEPEPEPTETGTATPSPSPTEP